MHTNITNSAPEAEQQQSAPLAKHLIVCFPQSARHMLDLGEQQREIAFFFWVNNYIQMLGSCNCRRAGFSFGLKLKILIFLRKLYIT